LIESQLFFDRYSIQRRHLTQFRKAKTEMVILILRFILQFFPSFLLYLSVLIVGDGPDVDLSTWANLLLISSSALLGPFLNQTICSKTLKSCRVFLCSNPNEVVVVAWKIVIVSFKAHTIHNESCFVRRHFKYAEIVLYFNEQQICWQWNQCCMIPCCQWLIIPYVVQ